MTVWKYQIEITDRQLVLMPATATILTAQLQHGNLCLWALIDQSRQHIANREILICGTGHEMGEPSEGMEFNYISTFQMNGGSLIFHVFEVREAQWTAPELAAMVDGRLLERV